MAVLWMKGAQLTLLGREESKLICGTRVVRKALSVISILKNHTKAIGGFRQDLYDCVNCQCMES